MLFRSISILFVLSIFVSGNIFSQIKTNENKTTLSEKTTFQTGGEWKPTTDVRSDVAIVYGTQERKEMSFEQRVKSWRERGYTVHFMTGIAWGEYQDYFTGKWDGQNHLSEGQVEMDGDTIWHGKMVPYIVPTASFIEYMKQTQVKRAIDAGIDAIYLEEPEFWARAGYSEAFKKAWQDYYHFPWRAQHLSPENTYLSGKLKYQMYYNALNEVFTFAKEYGKSKGMNIRCYVPTHSLINYSAWRIISPEASLASLPCVDGYIAQVWTGTSRTPTFYNGVKKERVFENAFLEYGSMESMTAPTKRKMFFLTDPIEDRPRDWADYKVNYEATFTAQLLYPQIANYEVMPWPDRIYEGKYLNTTTNEKEQISKTYSAQMQIMVNSLNQVPASENKLDGSQGISVLMSNSLMFQRFPVHEGYEDEQLSNFYGLTLPFLKRGIPVSILHLENTGYPETWKDTKILIMTYANMKPLDPEAHKNISEWVRNGGMLIYCGKDDDPFQKVTEWWNSGSNNYQAPSEHLFELLGLGRAPGEGVYRCSKGSVCLIRQDPKYFVTAPNGDQQLFETVKKQYENITKSNLIEKNYFRLTRGPFEITAVMDESVSEEPYILKGHFIDLFNPELPVIAGKVVKPREQAYLYNLEYLKGADKPEVLAGSARAADVMVDGKSFSFVAKAPINTKGVMRVYVPSKPVKTVMTDSQNTIIEPAKTEWDEESKTCLLTFDNSPDGIWIKIHY